VTSLTSKPSTLASVDVLWAIRVPCDARSTWITFAISIIFVEILESLSGFTPRERIRHHWQDGSLHTKE